MWIRSQDRKSLFKCKEFYVEEVEVGDKEYFDIYDQDDYTIATYKTKERAIEVLDEIESILKNEDLLVNDMPQHCNGFVEYCTVNSNEKEKVYEMPKE